VPGLWILPYPPCNGDDGEEKDPRQTAAYLTFDPLELSNCTPYLEAKPLKLNAAQFPFPCSLQTVVTALYASDQAPEQAMLREELLRYLKNISQFELNTMEAVLAQTEAIGDPAVPCQEHMAKIKWVSMAFSRWEEYFPIEEPLTKEFRKLLPIGAALAITDPDFMIPGEHSFHQLLDTMQEGAIGWQANSAVAGRGLARELDNAINSASQWSENTDVDLTAIYTKLKAATEKDRGRARRMAQRVVEAEQGKQKATRAKLRAATMINTLLQQYRAPADVGDFLKGPWYESAQLLLLKYGAQSQEWNQMTSATDALLDSLQPADPAETEEEKGSSRRQRLFETITRIPKELKQWLLSLQHDTEGISQAISAIEIAHMEVLRQQPLALENISLIPSREPLAPQGSSEVQENVDKIDVGQWFLVTVAKKAPVRVQLALKIQSDQQLLFTNHMGTKAMQQGYAYFVALLKGGRAKPLDSGLSFSRSLAHAAEIRSAGDMTTLSGLIAEREAQENAARAKVDDQEAQLLLKEYNDAVKAQYERNEAEKYLKERAEDHHQTETKIEAEVELQADFDELEIEIEIDIDEQPNADEEQKTQQELKVELDRDYFNPRSTLNTDTADVASLFDLDILMGTWMGFHDGDKPLMAKLAAHDKKRDTYIFVDREGIKMRDLNKLELVSLMDMGLVDMLETRSNFRDEIARLRKELEE
jgi:hypothetical protein